ncbi:winged helix-turn-helix domain-containing protein [Bacteroides sp. 51]|uniref:winged helix-turn-helix domain-containing protein n=1 Tax=Bacteroides sp. 51 TaxID=2302938 RepID=UPI0013CF6105|nr:winged helix-turn-helix domain-containing protein [Bacteroides sp. 51]NDV84941.1 hypothetical protein [Bacteroides sp. 51]
MLKDKIGEHAGEIWHLLSNKGKLNLRDIGEATHYGQDVIFMSLGWLLRENKIRIHNKNGRQFYELNHYENELYG